MPTFKVRVKWGKQKFEGVEVNTDEPPSVFKMQLFSLSGVPPERQKVMISGTTLQDDDWGKAKPKIKENAMLMMMGSAEALPTAPEFETMFLEDLSEYEAALAMSLPKGLENFGNTCYMNASLQCLKVVPELRDALERFGTRSSQRVDTAASAMNTVPENIATNLNILYDLMERSTTRLPLLLFFNTMQKAVPHFSERDDKGAGFRQQDAHECWSAIISNLAQVLKTENKAKFMEQYFGVQFKTTYKCVESAEEQETSETEKAYQVSCFISQNIKYMHTAVKEGLEGTVEKNSPTLGRDAQYKKTSRISRLPGYLPVQFVRFFVGKAGDSEEIVAKKILKDIKFTIKLDMYEFCTPELQERLLPNRRRFKEVEDKKAAERAKAITEGRVHGPKAKQRQFEDEDEEETEYEPYDFPGDPGSNNSGYYELTAVLTHQGRSSSSGHYLAWVKYKEQEWLKLDDDKVSVVLEDDILKLSGGGDWHIAYILLYAPMKLEKLKDEEKDKPEAMDTQATQEQSSST